MSVMRAKMRVSQVLHQPSTGNDILEFYAVSGACGANGESEDNTYARYTPSATLKMTVNNPALTGKFREGQFFYIDFTEAPAS